MRLFDQFGELLLDSFASQVFGDDLAFGRDQEVGRDAADSVLFDDRGALAVGDGDYVGPSKPPACLCWSWRSAGSNSPVSTKFSMSITGASPRYRPAKGNSTPQSSPNVSPAS
jgi:hypothetical protein